MKYVVLLCDGMADYPIEELGGRTPMEAANKPNMDRLAAKSYVGLAKTVPNGFPAGSDVANLSMLGYSPKEYYTGRSPLEAVSMGVQMDADDLAFRCNLVTLSDEENYRDKTMLDYCAGDISSSEAAQIIETVQEMLGDEVYSFYPGVSYRHCLKVKGGCADLPVFTPPHDISLKPIREHIYKSESSRKLYELMEKSYSILKDHPVNVRRIAEGKNPANSIWLWGQGSKPDLDDFIDKFGLKGSIISAVDLLRGIGKSAEMATPEVEGATGYIDTNFEGKAYAAVDELSRGQDYVYIHVEAPDECGHRGELDNKIRSIEIIDNIMLPIILDALNEYDDYKIMIAPDHPTPLSTRTHARDAVPFMIYHKKCEVQGVDNFCERTAKETGNYVEHAYDLTRIMMNL
ncbi:MAG: cofactor-independent phosphoglycerate mutase [Clostridia bacterium]|nr:cofactor-independent phosphoglycerate mutase [Clostridia bacterium]